MFPELAELLAAMVEAITELDRQSNVIHPETRDAVQRMQEAYGRAARVMVSAGVARPGG